MKDQTARDRGQITVTEADSESASSSPAAEKFYIVGIGASAGGLEALERLFNRMSADTGMAFVVVQHLSPDFHSLMDELLLRQTDLPIHKVEDGMPLEPNTIYLLPAKKEMIVSEGRLLLTDKDPKQGLSLPIDTFFRSLAQDAGTHSIGIVLSGTGSDGSRGIRDIHDAGGLVIVQSEETAKFDGMPRSAMETGVVDIAMAPDEMAEALLRFSRNPVASELTLKADVLPVDEDGMNRLLRLLRDAYGIDFSYYKPSTVSRRIQRRLLLNQSNDFDRYVEQLAKDPNELNTLYRDLLVGVTHFFRDREAFGVIEQQVIPEILERVPPSEEIRVWVAGCATGEEAYSLGILFHEQLLASGRPLNVKIFATDEHQNSLEIAAHGLYPQQALADVSLQRREKYFIAKGDQFQVLPELRQLIVFARHNIIKDAPFTRMDLISCRNLLIYLQPPAQKKAISLFHFGMKTGGVLFLGPSEGVADFEEEFSSIDRHWKIVRKRRDVRLSSDLRLPLTLGSAPSTAGRHARGTWPSRTDEEVAAYAQLMNRFLPPSALVNERREILHLFNRAGDYLSMRDGRLTTDILSHCDPDLKTAIAGALQRAAKERQPIGYSGVHVQSAEGRRAIKLGVTPLLNAAADAKHFLITFETLNDLPDLPSDANMRESLESDDLSRARITSLEIELDRTRENLQSTIEELETSNEELHATNEELVASNEELQSTNEELHSVNEELYTVNAEYQRKITELTELNEDMDNLLTSTEVGVIFLDDNLCIRKLTPHISKLFNVVAADIGRPFDNFTHNIEYSELREDVARVQQSRTTVEKEVKDRFGRWHFLRVLPYRSQVSASGVVVTLIDIHSLKSAEVKLRDRDLELRAILDNSPAFILIKDLDGRYLTVSGQAEKHLGVPAERIEGKSDRELLPQRAADQMESQDRAVATTGEPVEVELQYELNGQRHSVLSSKYALRDEAERIIAIAGMWTDILHRTVAEENAREAIVHRDRFLATLSHELRNPIGAMNGAVQLLKRSVDDSATVRRAAGVLQRQLDMTKRLVDDLLDVSRITQGLVELRKETIDLRAVINEAVIATRSIMTAHQIRLRVAVPQEVQAVYGDAARLQQVFVNLLVNSAKYTPAGGSVELRMNRERHALTVVVTDSGVGMSEELQRKVFQPFVQADETLDRSEGGMGLGLALVKSLVELHAGSVKVHSLGEGQGTTFSVTLPITRRAFRTEEENGEIDAADEPANLKLLVVEDNDDAREMLKLLLESDGYQVTTAADGIAALSAINAEKPDIALVDIGLPELDGYQVARRVRNELGRRDMYLVALTGYGQPSDREKAHSAGFNAHLTKPVDMQQLKATLQRAARHVAK